MPTARPRMAPGTAWMVSLRRPSRRRGSTKLSSFQRSVAIPSNRATNKKPARARARKSSTRPSPKWDAVPCRPNATTTAAQPNRVKPRPSANNRTGQRRGARALRGPSSTAESKGSGRLIPISPSRRCRSGELRALLYQSRRRIVSGKMQFAGLFSSRFVVRRFIAVLRAAEKNGDESPDYQPALPPAPAGSTALDTPLPAGYNPSSRLRKPLVFCRLSPQREFAVE